MREPKGAKIFVCQTVFHLLVTITKAMHMKGPLPVLYVSDALVFDYTLIEKYFFQITSYPKTSIDLRWRDIRESYPYHIHQYRTRVKNLVVKECEGLVDWSIFKDSHLLIFNDGAPFVIFLMLFGKTQRITLLEDGEAIYSQINHDLKFWAKKIFLYPVLLGNSKYITDVEVRFPERLPRQIRSKAQVLDLDSLMSRLSDFEKNELLHFFDLDPTILLGLDDALLLITQPLSEDDIISEMDKIALYSRILEKYSSFKVYVKPHPRELTDYNKFWPEVEVLPHTPPVELFELTGVVFSKAVTLFSSAIHSIPAKESIFLGVDYNLEVEKGWKRNIGIKEVIK